MPKLDPDLRLRLPPASEVDLAGKQLAIVGGTNGLGRAIAQLAAARGARVIVVGQTFRDEGTPRIEFVRADLSRMSEAVRVGRALPAETLDALLLTTGIFAAPTRQETADGLERDMAVSYLSRLAILRELAPRLGRDRPATAARPRIFVMGFPGAGQAGTALDDLNAERAYSAMAVHMNTVAGNEALVLDAVSRHPGLDVFGLNPGLIQTDIRSNFLGAGTLKHRIVERLIGLFMPSPESYAARAVPLLFAPELERRSGAMFDQKARAIRRSEGLDGARVAALLSASEALVDRALARGDATIDARPG
jgi:NAD(P)-dependent dehydrogenase (short-subunit alcohol dehydrogenase family)